MGLTTGLGDPCGCPFQFRISYYQTCLTGRHRGLHHAKGSFLLQLAQVLRILSVCSMVLMSPAHKCYTHAPHAHILTCPVALARQARASPPFPWAPLCKR